MITGLPGDRSERRYRRVAASRAEGKRRNEANGGATVVRPIANARLYRSRERRRRWRRRRRSRRTLGDARTERRETPEEGRGRAASQRWKKGQKPWPEGGEVLPQRYNEADH